MTLRALKAVVDSGEGEVFMKIRGSAPTIIHMALGAVFPKSSLVNIFMAGCTVLGLHLREKEPALVVILRDSLKNFIRFYMALFAL